MNPVVHFEIAVNDPEKSTKFYQDLFGWKIQKWEGPADYWLIETRAKDQPGINGAIVKKQDYPVTDSSAFVNTIQVEDLDQTLDQVKKSGGIIVKDKMEIPMIGWIAYVKDLEGNAPCFLKSTGELM